MSFFCNATSFTPFEYLTPHISWSKLGDNTKVFSPGELLVLQNVTQHDAGRYMCKAENGLGLPDTATAVLNVLRKYKTGYITIIYYAYTLSSRWVARKIKSPRLLPAYLIYHQILVTSIDGNKSIEFRKENCNFHNEKDCLVG